MAVPWEQLEEDAGVMVMVVSGRGDGVSAWSPLWVWEAPGKRGGAEVASPGSRPRKVLTQHRAEQIFMMAPLAA